MEDNQNLHELAKHMADRFQREEEPYILFLGKACARAAGAALDKRLIQFLHNMIANQFPSVEQLLIPDEQGSLNLPEVLNQLTANMPSALRYMLLQRLYNSVPVPLFYQDLAVLAKSGYFRHIITTNFDTLLEQAFDNTGLRRGTDYQMFNPTTASQTNELTPSVQPTITLYKLHGDLGERRVAITQGEIEAALRPQSRVVRGELREDIIIVGYEFETKPIDQWLVNTGAGEMWWVSADPPQPQRMQPIEDARHINGIYGADAGPDRFFGHLCNLLLRLPILQALSTPLTEESSPPADALDVMSPVDFSTKPLHTEESEAGYLHGRLKRSQDVLNSLERGISLDVADVNAASQISYQKEQISNLENKLHGQRVLSAMEKLVNSIQSATADSNMVNFLQSQYDAVKLQYTQPTPNEHLISAAVGATLSLTQGLEGTAVHRDAVQELAASYQALG